MASNLNDSENKAIEFTDYDSEEDSDTEAGMDDVTSQFCVRLLVATCACPFQTRSILCRRFSNQSWKRIARNYRSPTRILLCCLPLVPTA